MQKLPALFFLFFTPSTTKQSIYTNELKNNIVSKKNRINYRTVNSADVKNIYIHYPGVNRFDHVIFWHGFDLESQSGN